CDRGDVAILDGEVGFRGTAGRNEDAAPHDLVVSTHKLVSRDAPWRTSWARSVRKRLITFMAAPTSSLLTDSAGLWLMPSWHRTKSIATRVSAAICAASWPAPLGSLRTDTPESSTALSSNALSSGSAGTAGVS